MIPTKINNITSSGAFVYANIPNYVTFIFGQTSYWIGIAGSFLQCLRRGRGGRLLGSVLILGYTDETSESVYLHKYKESGGWITEEFDHVGGVDLLSIAEGVLASSLPQE
jgi:hypothetical protein